MITLDHNDNKAVNQLLARTKEAIRSAGSQNQALGITQAIVCAQHRDSGALDRSNFDSFVAILEKKFGDEDLYTRDPDVSYYVVYEARANWHIERFDHWAVGYIEYIVINCYSAPEDESGAPADSMQNDPNWARQLSGAMIEALDILRALERYPVVNEDHYSALESNELYEYLDSEIRAMRGSELKAKAPKSDSLIVHKMMQTSAFNNIGSVDDIRGDSIRDALLELDYTYKIDPIEKRRKQRAQESAARWERIQERAAQIERQNAAQQ